MSGLEYHFVTPPGCSDRYRELVEAIPEYKEATEITWSVEQLKSVPFLTEKLLIKFTSQNARERFSVKARGILEELRR